MRCEIQLKAKKIHTKTSIIATEGKMFSLYFLDVIAIFCFDQLIAPQQLFLPTVFE